MSDHLEYQQSEAPADRECCGGCPETDPPTRRHFLKILIGLCALTWGALTTYPLIQYLLPSGKEDSGPEVTSVSLGKEDAIPKGTGKNFQFGHGPALIVRNEAGEFHAFSAICSHLGCTVQYSTEKKDIYCACHGGQYDPQTGKNIAGPPPKPLTPLSVAVVKGEVIVSKQPAAKQGA